MKRKLALFTAIAAFSGSVYGATLQIDFSTRGGSQIGWETLGAASDVSSANGIYSGYTDLSAGNITVNITGIAFSRRSNNGASNINYPGTDLDAMYGDLLFRNNNSSTINVTISGLSVGTYQFKTHHLIDTPNPGAFILDVQDADSPGFGQSVGTFNQGTGTASTFNPNVITFDVESNGTDPVILRMTQGTASSGGSTGGWYGFNGMEIAIPEPSSAALFGLGALGVLLRRRR